MALLADKVVIITGVGPGMGQHMAETAAEEGAKVVMAARNGERLEELAESMRAKDADVLAVATNVASQDDCDALATAAVKEYGRIDALVCSAYRGGGGGDFNDASLESWQKVMDVTCYGAWRAAKAVVPHMISSGGGAIVNVGSMSSVKPFPGEEAYGFAKSALGGLTKQLAANLGRHNIRVNHARIGWMDGASLQAGLDMIRDGGGDPNEFLAPVRERISLPRIPTDAECARGALLLISDFAQVITGATIDINGGEYMTP